MIETCSRPPIADTKQPLDAFHALVEELSHALRNFAGLDSEEIDPHDIVAVMESYTSSTNEWQKYALADYSRAYTRNLVDKGNGSYNLLVLVWTPGKGSAVHDHANAHCVMKILFGKLKEILYEWPNNGHGVQCPLTVKSERVLGVNQVTYMSDELGLHKISNPDPENVAVSLHLYTPPHAATRGCHIFDEATSKPMLVKQPNFSVSGQRI